MVLQAPIPSGTPRLPTCQSTSDISKWLADNINTQYKTLIMPGTGNATVTTTLLQVMLGLQAAVPEVATPTVSVQCLVATHTIRPVAGRFTHSHDICKSRDCHKPHGNNVQLQQLTSVH
jgi:hypothetical protein